MASVVLAGCVSAPTPSHTNAPWTPPAAAQRPDNVWAAIRAQTVDYSKPLALAELTDMALQNSPASRMAWNAARAAAAQVEHAEGYFMPTVVGTAAVSRQRTIAEPDSFDQDFTRYAPGLQVNYLIFNFGGGRKAAVEQALQTVYAADFAFNRTLQDVLLAVETAYYSLISAEESVKAAEASAKDAKMAMDASQERMAAGLGTELEVLQARAGYDQSLYVLASAQGQLKIAHGSLAQVVGLPADTTINVAVPAMDVPQTLTAQDARRLIDDALNHRPDIATLRAALAAKQAAVKVAGASLWPSLYFNGAASRDVYDIRQGENFLPDRDWAFSGGLSLQWTLFDGFQTTSTRRAAVADAESAQAQLAQAELAASGDVWIRYSSYETALEKYKFSEAFLKSASASYDLALDSYKAGLKGILDLLDSESKLAQARSQYVAARQEILLTLVNLAYSTGLLEKGGAAQIQNTFSNTNH